MTSTIFAGFIICLVHHISGELKQPEQIHIAYGETPWDSISVTWSTQEPTLEPAEVRYGLKSGRSIELSERQSGLTREFRDGGSQGRVQYVHRVFLKGLLSDTSYVYRCGSGESWSDLFSFRTANSSSEWSPTLAIYGDMGSTNAQILPVIQDEVRNSRFDAIIHVGDFAYDMKDQIVPVHRHIMAAFNPVFKNMFSHPMKESLEELVKLKDCEPETMVLLFSYMYSGVLSETSESGILRELVHLTNKYQEEGRVGDAFMNELEPVAGNIPYMVCPGNHEQAYNFSHYRERFTMPGSSEGLFYSFDLGPAHFISLNTEAYYYLNYGETVLENQYKWLLNELEEANKPENRERRPWIIVYGHKPMYCSNIWIDDCSLRTAKVRVGLRNGSWYQYGLEELFFKNKVDLMFWGHEHSYERLLPVYDYQVMKGSEETPYTEPRAPVHVTTGAAGSKYEITNFSNYQPPWSGLRSTDYGYTRLEVRNRTHLHLQQISIKQGGRPVDDIWIVKNQRQWM